jgi:hypothetical protein
VLAAGLCFALAQLPTAADGALDVSPRLAVSPTTVTEPVASPDDTPPSPAGDPSTPAAPWAATAAGQSAPTADAATVEPLVASGVASTPAPDAPPAPVVPPPPPPTLATRFGNDVSWPQCAGPMPEPTTGFVVLGVTGGRPFSQNRCLADQWNWAITAGVPVGLYMNVAAPRPGDPAGMHGRAGDCVFEDFGCQARNFSANNVDAAVDYAQSIGADVPMWWLDVEEANHWTGSTSANAHMVLLAAEALVRRGIQPGVYSTPLMWRRITGGAQLEVPVWVAGARTDFDAPSWCGPDRSFDGAPVWMVQSLPVTIDVNWACDPLAADPSKAFHFPR